MKINYSDYYLKSNNDRFSSKYNKYNTYDSKRDFSDIYNYFSTSHGIAFFSTRREKHYQILNDTVFRALALITSNTEFDFRDTKTEIESIINSTVYRNARQHLKKDDPALIEKIDILYKELIDHNYTVDELNKIIEHVIDISFRKPISSPIPSNGSIFKIDRNIIKDLALETWKHVFQETKELKDVQNLEQRIDEDIKRFLQRNDYNQNELWIKSKQIGIGENKNEVDNIERIFKNDILKNNYIIQKLSDITRNKLSLNGHIDLIKTRVAYISNDIDKEIYTTNAKCCPTVCKSIKESFGLPF